MSNTVPNKNGLDKSKREKTDGMHSYLIQLYIVTPFIALVAGEIEQWVYDSVTLGQFGYNVYHNSRIWYTYMSKPFAVLIFIVIAYWFMLVFFKYTNKIYGKNKALIRYRIYSIIAFIIALFTSSYSIIFEEDMEYNLFVLTMIAGCIACAILLIIEIINVCKENKHWL